MKTDINKRAEKLSVDQTGLSASEQLALAQRLREAREYIGLLQEKVAVALDIPRASVSAIETGKRRITEYMGE